MAAGFRILPRRRTVPARTLGQFCTLPVANVSDCMGRLSAAGARLRPMRKGGCESAP